MDIRQWPDYSKQERRQRSVAEQVALVMGSDDINATEKAIENLSRILASTPKTGRVLESLHRKEFVIPLTSKEQKAETLDALSELGIFPWEEDGQLIIDHRSDLRKLEFARIYVPPAMIETSIAPEIPAGGELPAEFAFPLPTSNADVTEINKKISNANRRESFSKMPSTERRDQDEGMDRELDEIVNRFDQGILEDDEEEFVQTFGLLPTLTLFPRQYIWKARKLYEARSNREVSGEEYERLLAEAKEGNSHSIEKIARIHTGLVLSVLARVKNKFGGDPDDLLQEGMIGLLQSIKSHDPEKGKFSGYAKLSIEQKMRRYTFEEKFPIHRPIHTATDINEIRVEEKEAFHDTGSVDPNNVMARVSRQRKSRGDRSYEKIPSTGVGLDRLKRMYLMSAAFDPVDTSSEDNPIDTESINRANEDKGIISIPDEVIEKFARKTLEETLLKLSSRQERVLRLRFGIGVDREYTLEEVGDQMGVGRERIRQIEAKALRMLKHPSNSRALRTLLENY